jgi:dGTPase
MIESRQQREALEEMLLAPYAARSTRSHGRTFKENLTTRRVEFQRDRDRIVNCKSFRRLEYKTQVFVNGTADHYRTRLTHTIEMTSVGRTLARALQANEDLAAAICLAHDIGHSPFGHCGERELNKLMTDYGGFDHNVQSLRWVEMLEQGYPDFDGLNLSWEARAGLRKHVSKIPGSELDGKAIGPFQYLEGQIADVADDITYQAHDAQDGLEAGLLSLEGLRGLELWQQAEKRVRKRHPNCPEDRLALTTIRMLFTLQIEDVLAYAGDAIATHHPDSPEAVMNAPVRILQYSEAMKARLQPYRDYLFKHMYWHPEVEEANEEAVRMMRRLFMHYIEHPTDMGGKAQARIDEQGLWRTACDYVSGCTDRYAIEEYKRYGLA